MLLNPATINVERQSAPAVGITQAVYPVAAELKSALLLELLKRGGMTDDELAAFHAGLASAAL